MRKVALVAGTVTAIVMATPALAVAPEQAMEGSVSPSKAGTTAKPAKVKLNINTSATPANADPIGTSGAVIFFDKNLTFNPEGLPTCAKAVVARKASSCPAKTRVGTGELTAQVGGEKGPLKLTLVNGPSKTLWIKVEGQLLIPVNEVITAKLSKATGDYGNKLTLTLPAGLKEPAPGVIPTLLTFETSTSGASTGKGKKPYIGLKGCSGGELKFKGTFEYSDGSKTTANDTAPCKK